MIVQQRRAVGEGEGRQLQRLRAKRVDQVADAGPDDQVDDAVGEEVLHRAMGAGIDLGEGMRKLRVALHGMVKIMWSGMCSASAQ